MTRKRIGTIILIIGIIMILCAAGLLINNALSARKAEERSQSVLQELEDILSAAGEESNTAEETPEGETQDADSQQEQETYLPGPLPEVTVAGQGYIGILRIPALSLNLPVMSEYSEENLKIAPTRYYGELSDQNLVICAHNYYSHFGRLKNLQVRDLVQLTDMSGTVYDYIVCKVETIQPTEKDKVYSGEYDMMLLTCTADGSARVIVGCNIVE